jgi:hypothetical protein
MTRLASFAGLQHPCSTRGNLKNRSQLSSSGLSECVILISEICDPDHSKYPDQDSIIKFTETVHPSEPMAPRGFEPRQILKERIDKRHISSSKEKEAQKFGIQGPRGGGLSD